MAWTAPKIQALLLKLPSPAKNGPIGVKTHPVYTSPRALAAASQGSGFGKP
jgi:hypothetical protein